MTDFFREFASKSELSQYLADANAVLVGAEAESPRKFYGIIVSDKNRQTVKVGIVSSHHGIRPSYIFSQDGSVLVIGHDDRLTFVDVSGRMISTNVQLEGVFYEFIKQPDPKSFIVLHELGVAKYSFLGRELWLVSASEIVQNARVENDTIILQYEGAEKEMVIDISSGRARSL